MVALVSMVACEDKDSILKPRLLAGRLKELAYRHVGIADTLLDREMFLLIDVLIFLWNNKWVVT